MTMYPLSNIEKDNPYTKAVWKAVVECEGLGEVTDQREWPTKPKGVPAVIGCALLLDLVLTSSEWGDSKGSKPLLDLLATRWDEMTWYDEG
jgi:hypothetical protein